MSVTVVILTFDEEENLAHALDSVVGWADRIVVVDSFSTDRTLEIAERYGCAVSQNRFEDFARQRNFALDNLPPDTGWVFFLDADERMTEELRQEISALVAAEPRENGFLVKRRFIWMGRWIRRGYYPTWLLRLARHGAVRCEARAVNEHLVVEGDVGHLTHDFVHEDRRGVGEWIAKHNGYATREAAELLSATPGRDHLDARFWGTQAQRKRWVRAHVWNRLPPLVRPFLYFGYRYVLAGGFLDGKAGLTYHVLQALWYPFLIDVKYLEMRKAQRSGKAGPSRPTDDPG